jgi:hypothetical protein
VSSLGYKKYLQDFAWVPKPQTFKVLSALSRNVPLQSFSWPMSDKHFQMSAHTQEMSDLFYNLEERNKEFGLTLQ